MAFEFCDESGCWTELKDWIGLNNNIMDLFITLMLILNFFLELVLEFPNILNQNYLPKSQVAWTNCISRVMLKIK